MLWVKLCENPIMITNQELARRLQSEAHQLSQQGDNLYRIRAYRRAAMALLRLQEPIETMMPSNIQQVPGIGRSIAKRLLEEMTTAQLGHRVS